MGESIPHDCPRGTSAVRFVRATQRSSSLGRLLKPLRRRCHPNRTGRQRVERRLKSLICFLVFTTCCIPLCGLPPGKRLHYGAYAALAMPALARCVGASLAAPVVVGSAALRSGQAPPLCSRRAFPSLVFRVGPAESRLDARVGKRPVQQLNRTDEPAQNLRSGAVSPHSR